MSPPDPRPSSGAASMQAVSPRRSRYAPTPGDDPATSLCAAGVDVLGLTGVGIMLLSGTRLDCVAVSDDATGDIEALELMVGEGPCLDAFRTAPRASMQIWPTTVRHLDGVSRTQRWRPASRRVRLPGRGRRRLHRRVELLPRHCG